MSKLQNNIKNLFDILIVQATELGGSIAYLSIAVLCVFFDYKLFLELVTSFVLIMIVSMTIKYLFFKERPKKQPKNNIVQRFDASSFPSIHSMRIFALAYWIGLSINNNLAWIYLGLIALTVGYSRIYLKKHYFIDVFGGVVLTAILLLIQTLYIDVLVQSIL